MQEIAFIICCTKKKIWNVNPNSPKKVKAKDAYVGNLFKLAKELVIKLNAPWWIISAKYGILAPDEEIENYNMHIKQSKLTPEIIKKQLIEKGIVNYKKIVILAGTDYCKLIEKVAKDLGIHVETPLKGLPLGKMLAKLKEMISTIDESSKYKKLTEFLF